jgi:thiol-disulfide isomerase/thioredoxin
MKHLLILVCLYIGMSTSTLFAQQNTIEPPTFRFNATSLNDVPDTVTIFIRKGPLIGNEFGERFKLSPNADGSFHFKASFVQPFYWIEIYFKYHKTRQRAKSAIYYAEPNDNLIIAYKKSADTSKTQKQTFLPKMIFNFSGTGSKKYSVVESLTKIRDDLPMILTADTRIFFGKNKTSKDSLIKILNEQKLNPYFETISKHIQLSTQQIRDTLEKHENQIGSNMATFLSNEISCSIYFSHWMDYLSRISESKYLKEAIARFYVTNKGAFSTNTTGSLMDFSIDYKFNLIRQIMNEQKIVNVDETQRFEKLYEAVKSSTTGKNKNVLITQFLIEPWFHQNINNNDAQDSCIRDAIKIVKDPELLKYIKHQLVYFRGSKIPDFSFVDLTGKQVELSHLKGKVFMMDFYFSGCKGCIEFAKKFKSQIYPQFSDNPDFKVLSVSIDATRKNWISAVNSGLYNEKSYINLSAGKDEWKHPFLKHFNRTVFPFIIIVDKNGKLISKIENESSLVIIDLIKKGLQEDTNTKPKS